MTPPAMPAARGAPALTPARLAEFRDQLEEQIAFRTLQLQRLRESRQRVADGAANVRAEGTREVGETLFAAARAAMRDLTDALRRMADGTYGWCVACGEALPFERLEVVPQVARCLPCQRRAELG